MDSVPQSPASSTKTQRRSTGFPEPFCGQRNTSLPHPEADQSPNACIWADDIPVGRVASRQRRSLFDRHKKYAKNHGFLAPETEHMYSDSNNNSALFISESASASSANLATALKLQRSGSYRSFHRQQFSNGSSSSSSGSGGSGGERPSKDGGRDSLGGTDGLDESPMQPKQLAAGFAPKPQMASLHAGVGTDALESRHKFRRWWKHGES